MASPCDTFRDTIADLEGELRDKQEALGTATPSQKGNLMARIKEIQQEDLPRARQDLQACLVSPPDAGSFPAPDLPIPGIRILAWEFNQGLPGYRLVAGKDTLVRVFLAAAPIPPGGFGFFPSLDYASLRVTAPGGRTIEVRATMPSLFTNLNQLFSENSNANFYVSGRNLPSSGTYSFEASFYRGGRIVGRQNLGTSTLLPTRDLRILVVVENFVMPDEAWDDLDGAMRILNRNFPMRTGVGPLDGDQANGLRYFIEPEPLALGFTGSILTLGPLVARLTSFNAAQASAGRPDRADKIMTVRTLQPGEGGVGGNAQGFVLASVVHRTGASFPPIVCQEIGHLFGASVLGLPSSSHTPSTAINDPSAFDLLNQRTIADARPFMQAQVGEWGANCLLETADWNAMTPGFAQLDSTGTP